MLKHFTSGLYVPEPSKRITTRARFCVIAAIVVLAIVSATAIAESGTESKMKITISFDLVRVPIEAGKDPIRRHLSRVYTLDGSRDLTFYAPDFGPPTTLSIGDSHNLRSSDDQPFTLTFHVLGGVISFTSERHGYTFVGNIYTGKDSCHAALNFLKKNGTENFEVEGPQGSQFYKDMHAENITCSMDVYSSASRLLEIDPRCEIMKRKVACTCALQYGGHLSANGRHWSEPHTADAGSRTLRVFQVCIEDAVENGQIDPP
jgi:hypothetical protein